MRSENTIKHHHQKLDTMYEDSQRFSEGEEEEESRVITINPHLLVDVRGDRSMRRQDDIEPVDSMAFTMQRVVDRNTRSPLMGGDVAVDTPEYTNIREESMQRILSRLSPNGRRAFLQTMSEGEGEARPPDPSLFQIPTMNMNQAKVWIDQTQGLRSITFLIHRYPSRLLNH